MKKIVLKKHLALKDDIYVLPPDTSGINVKSKEKNIINTNVFFYPATGMIYKNHKLLFEATRILEKNNFNIRVLCTLSNDDVTNLGLTVPKSVELLGFISKEKVSQLYRKSILVFPSLIETYGLPLMEARMSGDYILAGDTAFGEEVLNNYPNKMFFNPHNVRDLVNLMELCIENKIKIEKKEDIVNHNNQELVELLVENSEIR